MILRGGSRTSKKQEEERWLLLRIAIPAQSWSFDRYSTALVIASGYAVRRREICPARRILCYQLEKPLFSSMAVFGTGMGSVISSILRRQEQDSGKTRLKGIKRDRKTRLQLRALGWKVLVVWECELRSPNRDRLKRRIQGAASCAYSLIFPFLLHRHQAPILFPPLSRLAYVEIFGILSSQSTARRTAAGSCRAPLDHLRTSFGFPNIVEIHDLG